MAVFKGNEAVSYDPFQKIWPQTTAIWELRKHGKDDFVFGGGHNSELQEKYQRSKIPKLDGLTLKDLFVCK